MTVGDFTTSNSNTQKSTNHGLEVSPIILGGAAFVSFGVFILFCGTCVPRSQIISNIAVGIFYTLEQSNIYNSDDELKRNTPESTLLFAFRNGINAIDTSPYYGNSESVIGGIVSKPKFRAEFPRSSYHILTKCGRYGPKVEDFDYSPERLIRSVQESCHLMGTNYLDAVYLHDVEFLAEDPHGFKEGGHVRSPLNSRFSHLDHEPGSKDSTWSYGPGDDTIILAVKTLFQLKKRGIIRKVGISGYPLGTLLRLSHLIKAQLGYPLDLVMSYACLSLQNNTLNSYIAHFETAGVNQIISASPFAMGLLTTRGAPAWHPAPEALRETVQNIAETVQEIFNTPLERICLRHSLQFPCTVVGVSSIEEVKSALEAFTEIQTKKYDSNARDAQVWAQSTLKSSGFYNWSWPSQ